VQLEVRDIPGFVGKCAYEFGLKALEDLLM
jgi:hypothetical protein